jgi:hypothetical protein
VVAADVSRNTVAELLLRGTPGVDADDGRARAGLALDGHVSQASGELNRRGHAGGNPIRDGTAAHAAPFGEDLKGGGERQGLARAGNEQLGEVEIGQVEESIHPVPRAPPFREGRKRGLLVVVPHTV